jgi:hypothetical protein
VTSAEFDAMPARAWRERFMSALGPIRSSFVEALSGGAAGGNVIHYLDTELRVDQKRRIVANAGDPRNWVERDGLLQLTNATVPGRLSLGFVVGADRWLPATDFLHHVVDLCRGVQWPAASEIAVARFVNLCVVEPFHEAGRELVIWDLVANMMASGKAEDNVYDGLFGLATDYDICYQDIQKGAPFSGSLCPDRNGTVGKRSDIFRQYSAERWSYIDDEVFSQVAQIIESEADHVNSSLPGSSLG